MKKTQKIGLFLILLMLTPALFGQNKTQADRLFNQAAQFYQSGQYELAIKQFDKAEAIYSQFTDERNLQAYTHLWRGLSFLSLYQYIRAESDFILAVEQAELRGFSDVQLSARVYLGQTALYLDHWDQANRSYSEALDYAKETGQYPYYPAIYAGLADVQFAWAQYDEAQRFYELSLSYGEQLQAEQNILYAEMGLARIHLGRNQGERAVEALNELITRPDIESSQYYGSLLNSLGMALFNSGQNSQAEEVYLRALTLAEAQGNIIELMRLYIHLGGVYHQNKDYNQALKAYHSALPLLQEYQREADHAVCLSNIALAHTYLTEYAEAIPFYLDSIAIKEQLRLSAEGKDRLDYLAGEVHVYQMLSANFLFMQDYPSAMDTLELATAKYLKEQLSPRGDLSFSGIESYQSGLEPGVTLLRYADIMGSWDTLYRVDHRSMVGLVLDPGPLRQAISSDSQIHFHHLREDQRGISSIDSIPVASENMSVEQIITYYRLLLTSVENEQKIIEIGRLLYDYLIAPVEEQLVETNHLLIVPDGPLAFLPFETLVMPDGRFLVEKYDVSYTQSLAVSEIINERNHDNSRKDFLAFGAADYQDFTSHSQGRFRWMDLPGTLRELEGLAPLFTEPELFTGRQVSETLLKDLSRTGRLREFHTIHFASHGMLLPEDPESSALVLTDFQGEDGYVKLSEIAQLDLAADFVNLSACETGLGQIYGGEGIVGLGQSFLIAGANSLSLTLWQVNDLSTSEFMIGFYSKVQQEGLSRQEAMGLMKREFITSTNYRHPYYWAPFIFFGN